MLISLSPIFLDWREERETICLCLSFFIFILGFFFINLVCLLKDWIAPQKENKLIMCFALVSFKDSRKREATSSSQGRVCEFMLGKPWSSTILTLQLHVIMCWSNEIAMWFFFLVSADYLWEEWLTQMALLWLNSS